MSLPQSTNTFDAKDSAFLLNKLGDTHADLCRHHLSTLSMDQHVLVQKEMLAHYPPRVFVKWFGPENMAKQLTGDPLLASMHNPSVWLYALDRSLHTPMGACSMLHAYWSGVALMRPSEHFEPGLLADIHRCVGKAVALAAMGNQAWTTGLTPAVLSCPEEIAMFDVPWERALEAVTACTLQHRDVGSLQHMAMAYPTLTVMIRIMEGGFFPERYQNNPLPWPAPSIVAPWSDDMQLAAHAAALHPQLRHWWTISPRPLELPGHLQEAGLMLSIEVQLGYFETIKDWIARQ